jgi:endonuclease/exonuclease/phosphatase family metal-dependent hydrolase
MARMSGICLSVLFVLAARSGAAQTIDPIVLCGCAATTIVDWTAAADCSQPLSSPDQGWASTSALASPAKYFEHTFTAPAGSYRVWFRVRALNDSNANDSVYVQYSDALNASNQPIYRIGTTSALVVNLATDYAATNLRGWGWVDTAFWLWQTTTVKFAAGGSHTIRVQVREDGVSVDQIVLSSTTYRTVSPGARSDDQTRLSCPLPNQPPPPLPDAPAGPAPADAALDVLPGIGVSWQPSANATTYDVAFGTSNPPPVVSTNQPGTNYQPLAALAYGTTYFWQVVARGAGGTTTGPVWTFTTAPLPSGDAPSVANTNLKRLRVVTWNIKQGYNMIDGRNDYNLQIDMMAGLMPDVICLQEVSLSDADMPTLILNGLSARTGRTWRGQYQRQNTQTTPTTNNLGSMILTWLPIDAISSTLFTAGLSQPFPALRLQVTVNGAPVHISTTHLYAWDADVRAAQLAVLQTWLSAQGARRVVTGDFNAFPFETTMWNGNWTLEYADAWQTATSWIQPTDDGGFTFDRRTATQNPERIDYHWTTGMTVSEMFVVKTRRSDHHALVVDYKVP